VEFVPKFLVNAPANSVFGTENLESWWSLTPKIGELDRECWLCWSIFNRSLFGAEDLPNTPPVELTGTAGPNDEVFGKVGWPSSDEAPS